MPNQNPIVYLNGNFMPLDEARVPVLDRGFIFGDGIYEVIPVYGGNILRLQGHLDRLDYSLEGIRMSSPLSHAEWKKVLNELIAKNGGGDLQIYMQITRGVAPRDHGFPKNLTPTVFAMCSPLKPLPEHFTKQGARAITTEDIRWQFCHIKLTSLLANTTLRQFAIDRNADEAILYKDGKITEGSASTVFAVMDGVLVTPPKDKCILPGITRELILEICAKNNIRCTEQNIPFEKLAGCDEIWVTSSLREIVPVTTLDEKPVGKGVPGPVWQKVYALFLDYKEQVRSGKTSP